MSFTIDTNVLVYASDADSPVHERARSVVEEALAGPGLVTFFWPVLLGYLRIVTHPRICAAPLAPARAHEAIERIDAAPAARVVGAGPNFWRCYRAVGGGRGNDVPDAVIVALMHEYGVATIVTHDRDFRRYDGISVRDPFAD
ncbi:TA system VapC family ribonuclease toxin [Skermania piniformis]|uniref:Ribonuclease VapC n=1 Tax=Skermania pinensis TaxID=39122 RepID=A0ABX8S7N6_9ACTN|nr:TA system VapC family ribonuclease toxin [Skermania piniformis]QXQ13855.1 PIN domain-containing protein [Skermania piniformis]